MDRNLLLRLLDHITAVYYTADAGGTGNGRCNATTCDTRKMFKTRIRTVGMCAVRYLKLSKLTQ